MGSGRWALAGNGRFEHRLQFAELGVGVCEEIGGGRVMSTVTLELQQPVYRAMWKHLLPKRQRNEEAAFGFARAVEGQDGAFELFDWRPILPVEFAFQSDYHLQLGDQARMEVIKHAHDLNASIVEFHSHLIEGPPEFSWSDIKGFKETVPHCLWRLKGKPYLAVVVSRAGFDGLVWFSKEGLPVQLDMIRAGRMRLNASGGTFPKL
jgi:hypothetical protein